MPLNDIQAASWIEKTESVCGGEARIRKTRHTVAGLVQSRRLGLADAEILCHHPDLSLVDLAAAWDYQASHPNEIDRAIADDENA